LRKANTLFRCHVTTGTKGQESLVGSPVQYQVYAQGCKGGWSLVTTTNEATKAHQAANAQRKEKSRVEVVEHFTSR